MSAGVGVVTLPHDLFVSGFPSIIREVARPVERIDDDVRVLVREMWAVLDGLGSGGGLAAPQVGVPLRLFVVELKEPHHPFGLDGADSEPDRAFRPIRACVIDPEVVSRDPRTRLDRESCYSLREYRGVLPRSVGLRVQARDEAGREVDWDLGAWPSRVFAHEIDHLDGVLYADHRVGPLEVVDPAGRSDGGDTEAAD